MKRIIVSGATSMLGVALIKEAISNGNEVIALVKKNSARLSRLPENINITKIFCDLENVEDLADKMPKCDDFYHFGWKNTDKEGRKDPILQEENILLTLKVVKFAAQIGCKKFLGAGSQAEFGFVDGIINEETPCHPETAYGIAKYAAGRLAENLCKQFGMKYVWGRIFSVYGINDNEGTMLNYAINQFINGEEARFSAGTQMWNYLNEKDAGEIFFRLGESENAQGVFCVANNQSMPLREYIEILRQTFEGNTKAVFAPENINPKVYGLEANTEKLMKITDFVPRVSFKKGISEVIAYRKGISR